MIRYSAPLIALLMLSACGGGGGGGSGGGSGGGAPSTPPLATVNVTLSATTATVATLDTQPAAFAFTATPASAVDAGAVADIVYDKAVVKVVSVTKTSAGAYQVQLATRANAKVGRGNSVVTFRLCSDATCTGVYPGSSQTFTLDADVRLADWTDFQRSPSHTAYVPVTLDPSKFRQIWDNHSYEISYPVTRGGLVYVAVRTNPLNSDKTSFLYAMREEDGSTAGRAGVGEVDAIGQPFIAGNRVFLEVAPAGSFGFDVSARSADTGSLLFQKTIRDWHRPPFSFAADADRLYLTTGTNIHPILRNSVFGLSASDGSTLWSYDDPDNDSPNWTIVNGVAPAHDEKNLYIMSYYGLQIFDKATGTKTKQIAGIKAQSTYLSAPILTDEYIAGLDFRDGQDGYDFSYGTPGTIEGNSNRSLFIYNTRTDTLAPNAGNLYTTAPAARHSVIYVSGNEYLYKVDLGTGTRGQFWRVPAGEKLIRNTVVTDNLVFVSTDKAIHAIDLTTKTSVWTFGSPGHMAISANQVLYITTGATQSDGRLVAIKLN